MKQLFALAAVLLLTACSSAHAAVPTLQRLDRMGGQLRLATQRSDQVSADVRALQRTVASGWMAAARRAAVRLKRDERMLATADARTAAAIRLLAGRESNRTVRHFYMLVLGALTWEWWEARTLGHLADQVWWDPLSERPGAYSSELLWSSRARWRAEVAGHLIARALAWRAAHPRDFRYIPVG